MAKLLLFTKVSLSAGGIENMAYHFLKEFSDTNKNEKIDVILLKNKKPPFQSRNIKFYCCGSKYKSFRVAKFTLTMFYLIKKRKYDFILSNHIILLKPFSIFFKKNLKKLNYGAFAYGIDAWNLGKDEINILNNADIIITISDFTASKLSEQLGKQIKNKIMFLYPAIDERQFFPEKKNKLLMKKYGIKDDSIVLFTLTRLSSKEKYKGYDIVVKILPKLVKKYPKIKYLIAGKGDDLDRIKQLIRKNKLESNACLCGFIHESEKRAYYNLCDIFVMPSKGEGFGIVFLEALACGKPVIAGNKDGSSEPLQHGKTGILIDPENKTELIKAISNIIEKKIPKKLTDENFLRRETVKKFGLSSFRKRVEELSEKINKIIS